MPQPLPAVCAGAPWRLPCRLTAALSRRTPCAAARSSPRQRTATTFAPFIAHHGGASRLCVRVRRCALPLQRAGCANVPTKPTEITPNAAIVGRVTGQVPGRVEHGHCGFQLVGVRHIPFILPKGFVLRTPQRSLALPPMCCHSVRRHPCVVHTPARLLASPLSTAPNTRGPLRPWVCIAIAGHGGGVG